MNTATSSVEFSFNNTMYKQTDGIAMGSPLGPVLANMFVIYHEALLFDFKPCMYQRYVDNIFAIFKMESDSEMVLQLNSFHPSLKFTIEKRNILDVYYHYLMSKSRRILTNFLLLFTGNLLSFGNTFQTQNQPHWYASLQNPKNLLQKQTTAGA